MLLKERSIQIDTDFTCDDFAGKVLSLYAEGKAGKEGGDAQ